MKPWERDAIAPADPGGDIPAGGTGIDTPVAQPGVWKIPPADQAARDAAASVVRANEVAGAQPWLSDAVAPPEPVLNRTLKQEMEDQTKRTFENALKTGIATSISKTVRGVGTTLLPKAAEAWAEKHLGMPTAEDVKLLEAGTHASPVATVTNVAGDIATDIAPFGRALRGAQGLKQVLPRAAAAGAALSGIRSEEGDVAKSAALGGAGGALGSAAASGLGVGLSHLVPTGEATKFLMRQGITPSMGPGTSNRVLKWAENQLERMPIVGAPIRATREDATRQLFNAAADLGIAPASGMRMPTGNAPEVVDDLLHGAQSHIGDVLNATTVRAGPTQQSAFNAWLDANAGRHNVAPEVVDRIKREMNGLLWGGTSNGRISGSALANIKENLFSGLNSVRGNNNAQQLMNEAGARFKDWLTTAAAQSGHDLAAANQAAANIHALRRAGVSEVGVSGPQLQRGVRANDRAVGAADTATREMRDLAEAAALTVPQPRNMFDSRSVDQLLRSVIPGIAKGGVHTILSPLSLAYGAVNRSDIARRLLMGDPATRRAVIRSMTPTAATIGEVNAP